MIITPSLLYYRAISNLIGVISFFQTLSEEERLARAKEKLTVFLTTKAEARFAAQQQQQLQQQQQQQRAAERSLTSHDIDNFMSQYCGEQVAMVPAPNAPPLPPLPPPAEPTLSSALAKLRAKKAAREGGPVPPPLPPQGLPPLPQQSLLLALDKLRNIHEPRPMFGGGLGTMPGTGRMSPQIKRPAAETEMDFESYKRLKLQVRQS